MDSIRELGDAGERARRQLAEVNTALGEAMTAAKEHEEQSRMFQSWWISERYVLEAVLEHVPAHDLAGVEHAIAASKERFASFFCGGSDVTGSPHTSTLDT